MQLGELQLKLIDDMCYQSTAESCDYKKTKIIAERRDRIKKNMTSKEYEIEEVLKYIQKMNIRRNNMILKTEGDIRKRKYIKELKHITGRLVLAWPNAKERRETDWMWWFYMMEVYVAWKYATKKQRDMYCPSKKNYNNKK